MPAVLTIADLVGNDRFKSGIVKCRLIHLEGRSVVQPDVLLSTNIHGNAFFVPKFFDASQIGFFDEPVNNFCRFTIVTENQILLRIGFFFRDKMRTCADGSVIYKCHFSRVSGNAAPVSNGTWRARLSRRYSGSSAGSAPSYTAVAARRSYDLCR